MTVYEVLKLAVDGVALMAAAGAWLAVWVQRRRQATVDQIDGLRAQIIALDGKHTARIEKLDSRLTRVETRLEDTPTVQGLHELSLAISSLGGDLKAAVARLDGLDALVQRMEKVVNRQERFLLDQAGRK